MKVWELKKINEYILNNDGVIYDYKRLVNFQQEDIDLLLQSIRAKNNNIKALYKFLDTLYENQYDLESNFTHLNGIESFDVKGFLYDSIVNADSEQKALAIVNNCIFNEYIINLLKTVEEYTTYINNINENMTVGNLRSITNENIERVLENITTGRCELIEKAMTYSLTVPDSLNLNERLSKNENINLNLMLDLLIKGYNFDIVRSFMYYEYNPDFQEVYNYLINSKLFDPEYNCSSLIDKFNDEDYKSEWLNMVNILKEIEEKEDKEVFDIAIQESIYLPYIRDYIREILYTNNIDVENYRQSLIDILKFILPSEEKINIIKNVMHMCFESNENPTETVKFIRNLDNVHLLNIVSGLVINKENQENRQKIYNYFPVILTQAYYDNEDREYCKRLLNNLCKLPAEICEKIMLIIGVSISTTTTVKQKAELMELLCDKENLPSLDYIYEQYKAKSIEIQEKKNKPQVTLEDSQSIQLYTVTDLLNNKYDIDKVFTGFDENDEITSKTLVRSLEYKK